MRRVIYSKYFRVAGERYYELKEVGEADFHCFGVDHEDFGHGVGSNSTAILELDDGKVITVPAEHIRFIKSGE